MQRTIIPDHFKSFPQDVAVKFRWIDLTDSQRDFKLFNKLKVSCGEDAVGIFVPTSKLCPKHCLVELSLYFQAQEREIKTLCEAVWCSHDDENPGFGVKIYKIESNHHSQIILGAKRGEWFEANDMNVSSDDYGDDYE